MRATPGRISVIMDQRIIARNVVGPWAALLACLLAGAGGCRDTSANGKGASASSPSTGHRKVVALGRLAPAGDVLEIMGLPGARIESFGSGFATDDRGKRRTVAGDPEEYGIREGGKVQANAPLVRLDSWNLLNTQLQAAQEKLKLADQERKQRINVAQAQVNQAQAAVAQAEAKKSEIEAQQAKIAALKKASDVANDEVQLIERLQKEDPGLVTTQQLARQQGKAAIAKAEHTAAEQALTPAVDAAQKTIDAAQANLELAEANLRMIKELDPTIAAAVEVESARQARDQTEIRAPGSKQIISSGDDEQAEAAAGSDRPTPQLQDEPPVYTVLDISVRPGEFVTQFPIMQIADLSKMVCIAEVYEADAKEISLNQEVIVTSAAFDEPFTKNGGGLKGTVDRISNLVANPGLVNRNPLAPSDRSVVEVRINIDPTQEGAMKQAARLVGMQVTVEFIPKPKGAGAAAADAE